MSQGIYLLLPYKIVPVIIALINRAHPVMFTEIITIASLNSIADIGVATLASITGITGITARSPGST
jgi:hypothetical protein